nr:hypothetical protein [Tanacetum cinerariifolium]
TIGLYGIAKVAFRYLWSGVKVEREGFVCGCIGRDSGGACRTLKVSLGTAQEGETGEEQEMAFQTLKDKLCNAPVIALLDRLEDFVVYCGTSGIGLGCVLMQRGKRRWIELFSDYDCEIRYPPGKANVVADSLSRKKRVKHKRVKAMNMTLQSSIKDMILVAQKEAVDESVGMQKAYKSRYSVHPRADKMYYDLRDRYWWPDVKKDIAVYVRIAMDFVTKLPRTGSGHDIIWVIVDRLTKSAHFLPMREDYKIDRLARLYLNKIVDGHGVSISIISDRAIKVLEVTARGIRNLFRHEYSLPPSDRWSDVRCALSEVLHGRKCRSPIMWAEIGEGQLIGPERKPLEFSVCEYVLLKVSPWKGVIRFGKKGKISLRFVGPFEIVKKVGPVAYRLDLPEELNGVHDMFHMSNLKKCLADPTLQVPLDEIQVDAKLNFMEESMKIVERELRS